jgi:hypothetical protein
MAVDFRKINEVLQEDARPIPNIQEVMDRLHGSTIFSKLDAASGFWQIPLDKSCRHLTAFHTHSG